MYTVQLRPVAPQYSDGTAKLAAATNNFETNDAPEDSVHTKQMWRFDQFNTNA
jgi:hypothetical protein